VPSFVQVVGEGYASLVQGTGPFYLFQFGTSGVRANLCSVTNLRISFTTAQSSGGGFDYTFAANNLTVTDITVWNNVATSFYVCPNADGCGVYFIERVRWNAGLNYVFGIYVGNGTNQVASVVIRDCSGTAGIPASCNPQVIWVTINYADTVLMTDCGFQYGGSGLLIENYGTKPVTGATFVNVTFDMMSAFGISVGYAVNTQMVACRVNSCGNGSLQPAVIVGASCNTLRLTGSTVMTSRGHGVSIQAGATETTISDCVIANNGVVIVTSSITNPDLSQSCTATWGVPSPTDGPYYGIAVAAGATRFYLTGNVIGNTAIAGNPDGHCAASVFVGSASDHYIIAMNRLGESLVLIDGGAPSGTKQVLGNVS
jgi:hypothetical protein